MIVELKAVSRLHPLHRAQLISYLKGFDKPLGILANFGGASLEHATYPNKTDQKTPIADCFDFEKIRMKDKDDIKDPLVMANRILVTLGAGYFHQVYRRALYSELKRFGSAFIHPDRSSIPRCKSESSVLTWFEWKNETTPAFQSKEGVENADGIRNQKTRQFPRMKYRNSLKRWSGKLKTAWRSKSAGAVSSSPEWFLNPLPRKKRPRQTFMEEPKRFSASRPAYLFPNTWKKAGKSDFGRIFRYQRTDQALLSGSVMMFI